MSTQMDVEGDEENQLAMVASRHVTPPPPPQVLALNLKVIAVVAIVGYIVELVNDHRRITAQIVEYGVRGPPPGCAGTERARQSWGDWVVGANAFNVNDCNEYTRVVSQSTWPNPFRVFVACFCDVWLVPLQNVIRVFGSTMVLALGVCCCCVGVAGLVVSFMHSRRRLDYYIVDRDLRSTYQWNYEQQVVKQC